MAKIFEKLIFGGLHEKHTVQRGIWVPTQHLLWDQGKPRKTLIELAWRYSNTPQTWRATARTAEETHFLWCRATVALVSVAVPT
jgi:hypothetical protein